MDSVQVGKAVFVKESYTTLGIEPRTYSYPGRSVNHTSVCWVVLEEILSGPSVTPRSSGFGGGSGTPRASGSVATPRGGGGYPGGVTPGGSTPRSVEMNTFKKLWMKYWFKSPFL